MTAVGINKGRTLVAMHRLARTSMAIIKAVFIFNLCAYR
jgi:hypothetical protein